MAFGDNLFSAFASLDEEILEAPIMESEYSSAHTKQRCNESKRWRSSQPLEMNSLGAFASLDEEILETSIMESAYSSAHTTTTDGL